MSNKRILFAAALAATLAVTACGGGSKTATVAAPPPTTSSSVEDSNTTTPTDTDATPTDTDAAPTDSVAISPDTAVLTADQVGTKCASLTAAVSPTDSSSATDDSSAADDGTGDGGYPTDSDTDSTGFGLDSGTAAGDGKAVAISDHGIVLISCADPESALFAVDLVHGTDLWNQPLQSTDASGDSSQDATAQYLLGAGEENVYLLTVNHIAATGLKDAFVTRTISALNLQTGATSWTEPLAPNDQQSNATSGDVTETAGPTVGHREVVVSLDGLDDNSAFDAATGQALWRVPDLNAEVGDGATTEFVADNLAVFTDSDDNGDHQFGVIDVSTSKVRWVQAAANTAVDQSDQRGELVGSSYWFIGDTGADAFDLATGKQTAHVVYPTSFSHVLATPTRTVGLVDGTLRCFATGNWAKPLWTVTAGDITPTLIAGNTLVVQAQSGDQLLNMADGSILGPAPDGVPGDGPVVDGLQILDDGGVFAYASPS